MAEMHGSHDDNLSWNDQTWSFPNLGDNDDQHFEKSIDVTNNSDGQKAAAKSAEEAPKGRKRSTVDGVGGRDQKEKEEKGGGGGSEHEMHIWTERERRKKMRNMFANLHALLPQLPPKADKSTIVDEAINYIRKMQQALQKLEIKRKAQMLQYGITNNPYRMKPGLIQSREAFLADQGAAAARNSAVGLPNTNIRSPISLSSGLQLPPFFKTWTSPSVTLSVCGDDAHISVCGPRKPGLLTAICFVMDKYNMEVVSAQISCDANRCMYMFHAHANNVGNDQSQEPVPGEEICKQAAAEIMYWVNYGH